VLSPLGIATNLTIEASAKFSSTESSPYIDIVATLVPVSTAVTLAVKVEEAPVGFSKVTIVQTINPSTEVKVTEPSAAV
jgi:hypothetical protein